MLALAVGFVLGMWLLITAICQFKSSVATKIRQWDSLFLIPAWTFFSPNPGTKDYRLVVQVANDPDKSWQIAERTHPNSLSAFIFNPNKIRKKCLIDISNQIIEARNNLHSEPRLLWITHAYLSVLNRAQHALGESLGQGDRFRFSIIANSGYRNSEPISLVILSEEHTK